MPERRITPEKFPLVEHKKQIDAKIKTIFEKPHESMRKSDSFMSVTLETARLEVSKQENDEIEKVSIHDGLDKGNFRRFMSITFDSDQNPQIKMTHSIYGRGFEIIYGSPDEKGLVSLPDQTVIYSHLGKSIYTFSDKTVDWQSGIALLIEEDEDAETLTVRDDYESKRAAFPTEVNVYKALDMFLDR